MGASGRLAVVGAGSWGTTIAHVASQRGPVRLWARDPALAGTINDDHVNPRYLPGAQLDPAVDASSDLGHVLDGADAVLVAVPAVAFRATTALVLADLPVGVPVVSLTKGLEVGTDRRMTEIVTELDPGRPAGVLTGPNLAREILDGHAAASVLALTDPGLGVVLRDRLSTDAFRLYTNNDVVGCELAGALKNVIAIAAGMAVGLGAGDNARAALVTRGLAELTRLGTAMGGHPLTFSGLAGLGDLMVTCTSPLSRNRYVGEQIGRGRALADVLHEMRSVAEGVATVPVVVELGRRFGVELPIAGEVDAVLHHGRRVHDAERGLLGRRRRDERHGLD